MATDPAVGPVGRAYPLRAGCAAMGCAVLFLAFSGTGAAAVMPLGWEKARNGQGFDQVVGWLIVGLCGLAIPLLLLAPMMLVVAIRETLHPQWLRVTATALLLPERLRNPRPADKAGNLQPEEVPFAAIRRVRTEEGPGGRQLLVAHDLSPATLTIPQLALQPADFDELEAILRAAVPAAFAVPPDAMHRPPA